MTQYLAGWDGGGTKTICEIEPLGGGQPRRLRSGPLNLNGATAGSAERTAAELLAQMAQVMRPAGGLAGCRMLCIGAAGISNPETERKLRAVLAEAGYAGPVVFTGDQQTALYGALGGSGGAVLIAGTGSICYGRTADGREARTGGWGSLMDDEGGGYAIGRDILAAAVRSFDGRTPKSVLEEAVLERLGVRDIGGLIQKIYAPDTGKKQIAALAPLLSPALAQKDAAALAICQKAARELALLTTPVITALGLQSACLALAGSILCKEQNVRAAAVGAIHDKFPVLACVAPQSDAAHGAVLIAREAAGM